MNAHPAAQLFPMMDDTELTQLAADIEKHGLREPITLYGGQVLDGRNRLRACEIAGVAPEFVEWPAPDGASATDFVVSLNLHRRHLSKSQWAMIANDARTLYEDEARSHQRGGQGGVLLPTANGESKLPPVETARRAAEAVGVGVNAVYEAARVKREAPQLAEAVQAGEISVGTAIREITGTRKTRSYVRDKHAELVKRTATVADLCGKWERPMTDALTPPQARKQLTVLNKAAALLAEVIEAVEYRAATLQTFNGR